VSRLTPVDDARFATEVLESERPVVVDFWAAWCPPCRVMSPILGELAEAHPDVRFVAIDVDESQETAARYGVLSMPTFIVFRGGEAVQTLIGSRPRARFVRELAEALPELAAAVA
jgi:thioredoxin 1